MSRDGAIDAAAAALGLTPAEAERRKAFLSFGQADARLLADADAALRDIRQELPARFCEHLRRFDETWRLIREEDAQNGLLRAQAAYLAGLTGGDYDWDYARQQLGVGLLHARLGLEPRWFIGAHAVHLAPLLEALFAAHAEDPRGFLATTLALLKVMLLDIGFGIDAYYHAVSERMRSAERAAQDAQALSQTVLDSLGQRVAVVDDDGTLVAVNEAWGRSARREGNPLLTGAHPGADYFALCRTARVVGGQPVEPFLAGMGAVLNREADAFDWLYTAGADDGGRVYLVRVHPLAHTATPRIVVSHHDLTEQRRADQAAAEESVRLAEQERHERERRSLRRIAEPAFTGETARSFGLASLRESDATLFHSLTEEFSELLERAIEQRAYKISFDLSERLRGIAARLETRRVGPRDVIEIYGAALEERRRGVAPLKARAYAEEGQVLALELMGYLVSRYRSEAMGSNRVGAAVHGAEGSGKREDG